MQFRFGFPVVTAKMVCEAIAERQDLTPEEASMFNMWVVSKDLELQIRPDQDLFGMMVIWNNW